MIRRIWARNLTGIIAPDKVLRNTFFNVAKNQKVIFSMVYIFW